MYDPIEPNRPPGKGLGCLMGKSLGEDAAGTGAACTAKAPDGHRRDHGTSMRWQIRDSPAVMAMNPVRDDSTCWTLTGPRSSAVRDNHLAMLAAHSVNQQSRRYQTRTKEFLRHRQPLNRKLRSSLQTASRLSQSQSSMPKHTQTGLAKKRVAGRDIFAHDASETGDLVRIQATGRSMIIDPLQS
jgi:hypothetical protein